MMLKLLNFLNTSNNVVKSKSIYNNALYNNFNLPKLNILDKDCVSFTSRAKEKKQDTPDTVKSAAVGSSSADSKTLKDKKRTITNKLAQDISAITDAHTRELKYTVGKCLSHLVQNPDLPCNYEHPIYRLEFRTKGANSIREKASQKHLTSKEGVIGNLHDLAGARIIMGTRANGSVEKVLDELSKSVKDGKLKIVEVENHIPTDTKYQYVSQAKLRKLAQISSDRFSIMVPERITRNETGYTAIHMLVEFNDGITGEIQILGKDVALFKELEDISYKVLRAKSVAPKYSSIVEILKPLVPVGTDMSTPENIARAKLRKEFIAYTTAAYKHEREKEGVASKMNTVPKFLTLDEFSRTQRGKIHLTRDMDFNNLYELKTKADGMILSRLPK